MGFDTIVHDDPQFPSDLLPYDRRYRPDLGGGTGKGGVFVLMFIFSIFLIIAFYRTFPIPTHFESFAFYAGLVICFVALHIYRKLRALRVLTGVLDAVALGGRGEFTKAEKLLDDACVRGRASKAVHCYAVYERAVVAMRRGDLQNALGMTGAIYLSRALSQSGSSWQMYWGFSLGLLARCLALQGKIAEAEKWQTHARAHVIEAWSASLLPTDVLIGLRTGRAVTVLADAEREWPAAEATLRGWDIRALRLYCAFGAAHLAPEDGRKQAADVWIAGLHPRRPGEFAYLAKSWPEMQEFISTHGL